VRRLEERDFGVDPHRITQPYLFMDRLERSLMRAERRGNSVAILFVDLDDFKVVNDSLGPDTGVSCYIEVGRRLDSGVRISDARLGGDEFVVLPDDAGDEEEATVVADRIRRLLEAPFELGEHQAHVTASIGVAVKVSPGERPQRLLRYAHLATYRAKEKGRNRCEI
jgi:diguanylate cyclase (GGDEF)-like protein